MINPTNVLTVIKYDGVSYTNVTTEASDPSMDTFRHELDTGKYLYVGYDKVISALYLYLGATVNLAGGSMIVEYWNGTAWTQLSVVDQTQYLKMSGIINWKAPTDATETTIEGLPKCWVRLSGTSLSTLAITFQYVGLLFSDDTDIGLEYPSVLKECFYPQGKTDFVIYHIAAKDYIMSELLRKGYTKKVDGKTEPINQWDVLNIYELRQASLYYAMSQIFFNLSDNSSDNYWQKYTEYKAKFENAINLGMLRIDQDNDGQVDEDEKQPIKSYRWVR
jgi:hypothetical protein